jgi:hypothetical protein
MRTSIGAKAGFIFATCMANYIVMILFFLYGVKRRNEKRARRLQTESSHGGDAANLVINT